MLELARRLRRRGVLGINQRNAQYVSLHNARKRYPLVDDKLRTKELAVAAGMAVPELYGVLSTQHDVRDLPALLAAHDDFVMKPAQGSGGNGILVVTGRRGELHRKPSGAWLSWGELRHHAANTLSGLYSLGGRRDRVMLEYRVRFDPVFEALAYQGVPDVRVIVFHGYPVMAMLRLPTRQSDGKANLHQGAVGVGIDLAAGRTLEGVQGSEPVAYHPDTGYPVAGLAIPHWPEILELAAHAWEITGLGYLGVDLVLDATLGPLILELNARPGLAIQIANREGLTRRLERVAAEPDDAAIADRLHFSKSRFGWR